MKRRTFLCIAVLLIYNDICVNAADSTEPEDYEINAVCLSDKEKTRAKMGFSVKARQGKGILNIHAMGDVNAYSDNSLTQCSISNFTKDGESYNLVIDFINGLPGSPKCGAKLTGKKKYTMGVIVTTRWVTTERAVFHQYTCDFTKENVITAKTKIEIGSSVGANQQTPVFLTPLTLLLMWFALWK